MRLNVFSLLRAAVFAVLWGLLEMWALARSRWRVRHADR